MMRSAAPQSLTPNPRSEASRRRQRRSSRPLALASLSALAVSLGLVAGCGGEGLPPPNPDGGPRDLGFRDGGPTDLGGDMNVPPTDLGGDVGPTDQGGGGTDGGGTDGGGTDGGGGGTDSGTPVGDAPQIANVAWTVAQDGSCGPASGILFTVVVTDADTITFNLEPTITGMGSCFFFGSSSATEMIDITLTNCPHDQDYTPTITVTDPEGNSDSVSGFTVEPCTNGSYFP